MRVQRILCLSYARFSFHLECVCLTLYRLFFCLNFNFEFTISFVVAGVVVVHLCFIWLWVWSVHDGNNALVAVDLNAIRNMNSFRIFLRKKIFLFSHDTTTTTTSTVSSWSHYFLEREIMIRKETTKSFYPSWYVFILVTFLFVKMRNVIHICG